MSNWWTYYNLSIENPEKNYMFYYFYARYSTASRFVSHRKGKNRFSGIHKRLVFYTLTLCVVYGQRFFTRDFLISLTQSSFFQIKPDGLILETIYNWLGWQHEIVDLRGENFIKKLQNHFEWKHYYLICAVWKRNTFHELRPSVHKTQTN